MIEENNHTYHANMEALKKHYPNLYGRISLLDDHPDIRAVRLSPDVGLPDVMLEKQSEKFYYYGGENPIEYCRRYIESLDLHYAPVLIFLGFGLGHQVACALNDFAGALNMQHVIIVEKDLKLFQTGLMTLDFTATINHPNIEIFAGIDPDELFKAFRKYLTRTPEVAHFFKSLKIVIMPSVELLDGEYYQKAFRSLKLSVMHALQHIGNDPYDSILGMEQMLSNVIPMIEDPGIIAFKDCLKGKPAIVAGAGPSLNKSMKFLREASQKALLVSVDAALKPLLDIGVRPHIVTNIERTIGQDVFFSSLGELDDIFFVFCPLVPPETYDAYNGPKIIANRYQEMNDWLELHTGALTGGPLVGNFAFSIARYLGCDPIIIVGQDLSFPPTGATHVEGMVFGTQEVYRRHMMEIEGYRGEKLLTNRCFEESRRSLELDIEHYDGLCINTSEGGAKINGAPFCDLKSTLEQYCRDRDDFRGPLQKIWEKERERKGETQKSELRRVMTVLDDTIATLEDSLDACKEGLGIVADFEERDDLLLDGKPNPSVLGAIRKEGDKLFHIREQIISNPSLRFLSYIYIGYHTDFAMKRNFLFDRFHDRSFALLKSFLMEREYFSVMGQLLLSTIFSINVAQEKLIKGLN